MQLRAKGEPGHNRPGMQSHKSRMTGRKLYPVPMLAFLTVLREKAVDNNVVALAVAFVSTACNHAAGGTELNGVAAFIAAAPALIRQVTVSFAVVVVAVIAAKVDNIHNVASIVFNDVSVHISLQSSRQQCD
jgi:hypothetical protein